MVERALRRSSFPISTFQFLAPVLLWLGAAAFAGAADTPNWMEVRSEHFVVASNAGEREARRIAEQFEHARSLFHNLFPDLKVDPLQPISVVAARDEATMRLFTAPEDWEGADHIHPAGLFHSDGEKDYVILRLDAEGTTAFHTVYHEYTHALLHLNFKKLPLWLSEGLAEFVANSVPGDKDVQAGPPDGASRYVLSKNEWLPIKTVFEATASSPYYNEKHPASIFYAESWAVTHYLLLDPEARRQQLIGKFLAAWDKTGDQLESAAEAFGDVDRFGETVHEHIRRGNSTAAVVPSIPQSATGAYATRELSPGEVLALRGDVFTRVNQMERARPLLEEAVHVAPQVAAAHEAMGLYDFRNDEFAAADQEMTKAIELDSADFMPFYCHGVLLLRELDRTKDATNKARTALENAARLNPQYAPTFEALTQAYSRSPETREKALVAAQMAVKLDPDSRSYKFGLAYTLLNNGRAAEARELAQQVLASSASTEDTAAARKLLNTVEEEQEWESASGEQAKLEAKDAGESLQSSTLPQSDRAAVPPAITRRRLGPPEWMAVDGPIAAIHCEHSPEATITLNLDKGPLSFHAADLRRVGMSGISQEAVPALETCSQWAGRRVKVWFRGVQGQEYVGELTKIYFY
jgi:tetratricopeptide (TPR) repeat protein